MATDDPETTQLNRPVRKRNPEESRKRILDAAQRAFALRGFAGARLRDIAHEAGVHHALVHHYYGDKRGLFREVVKRGLGRLSTAGLESLNETQGFEANVRAFVGVTFDFCANNRDLLRIIESAFRDPDSLAHRVAEEALGDLATPLLSALRGRIQEARAAGLIRDDMSVEAIVSLGFGAIVYRFVAAEGVMVAMGLQSGDRFELHEEREATIRFMLGAVRTPR